MSLKKTTYTSHIMDWDSNNHKIISLFRTTLDYSICTDFGSYDTIKELWDALAFRYSRSDALRQYAVCQYQLIIFQLHNLKQKTSQCINEFYAYMKFLWPSLASWHILGLSLRGLEILRASESTSTLPVPNGSSCKF
jgi:hypothetical protein